MTDQMKQTMSKGICNLAGDIGLSPAAGTVLYVPLRQQEGPPKFDWDTAVLNGNPDDLELLNNHWSWVRFIAVPLRTDGIMKIKEKEQWLISRSAVLKPVLEPIVAGVSKPQPVHIKAGSSSIPRLSESMM